MNVINDIFSLHFSTSRESRKVDAGWRGQKIVDSTGWKVGTSRGSRVWSFQCKTGMTSLLVLYSTLWFNTVNYSISASYSQSQKFVDRQWEKWKGTYDAKVKTWTLSTVLHHKIRCLQSVEISLYRKLTCKHQMLSGWSHATFEERLVVLVRKHSTEGTYVQHHMQIHCTFVSITSSQVFQSEQSPFYQHSIYNVVKKWKVFNILAGAK